MFDVALYGHLTHDRILNKFKQSATVGSIGNVWKTLKSINPKLRIDLQPTEIGEALIYINEDISERTSVANLSLYTQISGSICYNKEDTITSTVDIIENINVLGAGDMFAASFINSFLNTSDINKSVTVAHNTVSKLLNNEN